MSTIAEQPELTGRARLAGAIARHLAGGETHIPAAPPKAEDGPVAKKMASKDALDAMRPVTGLLTHIKPQEKAALGTCFALAPQTVHGRLSAMLKADASFCRREGKPAPLPALENQSSEAVAAKIIANLNDGLSADFQLDRVTTDIPKTPPAPTPVPVPAPAAVVPVESPAPAPVIPQTQGANALDPILSARWSKAPLEVAYKVVQWNLENIPQGSDGGRDIKGYHGIKLVTCLDDIEDYFVSSEEQESVREKRKRNKDQNQKAAMDLLAICAEANGVKITL